MNCDPIAHWYRWLEYAGFGRALERRRLAFLDRCGSARKVLMLGEGDGRFLAAFLRVNPTAVVDYVDGSCKMLALARRRAADTRTGLGRVRFHAADAPTWLKEQPLGGYDLICTHFFLDCFAQEELAPLGEAITRHAQATTRWLVSEFCYPSGIVSGRAGHLLIRLLYGFFRLAAGLRVSRLPQHEQVLNGLGFRCAERRLAAAGLLVSEDWERR